MRKIKIASLKKDMAKMEKEYAEKGKQLMELMYGVSDRGQNINYDDEGKIDLRGCAS